MVYLKNNPNTMYPCYELGLDRVFQVILGLSNPVVGNSLALLSNSQQRCFLDLGSNILCCKYYARVVFIMIVILFNILLFHLLTFVIHLESFS